MSGTWTWTWCLALTGVMLAGCSASSSGADRPASDLDFDLAATDTTGVVRGVVIDEAIRPIANAHVTLVGTKHETRTDEEGKFGFEGVLPATYVVEARKLGYKVAVGPALVEAGVDDPPILKLTLVFEPGTAPFVEAFAFQGYLSCGVAIIATSVGCTTFSAVADLVGDEAIWNINFTNLPRWSQGELVWTHTQPAGGYLIWEATEGGTNQFRGYRETTGSPALAYWDNATLEEHRDVVLSDGIDYRFFGGPHPLCTGVFFGCGVTLEQKVNAYIHNFYNFQPPEGWRFTVDGEPKLPE